MLLATWLVASGLACWAAVFHVFFPRLWLVEAIAFAAPVSFTATGWAALFVSTYYRYLYEHVIVKIALAQTAVCVYVLYTHPEATRKRLAGLAESLRSRSVASLALELLPFALLVPLQLAVTYVMHTHLLFEKNGNIMTGGNCYADLPFHLSVLNSFLYGKNSADFSMFRMSEVIFDGHRIVYSLIPDYYSAVLVRAGLSTRWALLVPSVILAWAFPAVLYCNSVRLTKSRMAGVAAVYLTILCGGDWDYSNPTFWLFFVQDIFLPQRSAMFAYTTLLASLTCLWIGMDIGHEERHESSEPSPAQQDRPAVDATWTKLGRLFPPPFAGGIAAMGPWWRAVIAWMDARLGDGGASAPRAVRRERWIYYELAGFLTGLLPYLQGHSFIAMAVIVPVTLVLEHFRPWRSWVPAFSDAMFFGGPALLLGVPQMTSFLGTADGDGFMKAQYMWIDWRGNDEGMMLWFETCLGIFFPLSVLAAFALPKRHRLRIVGHWLLFVICLVVKFQPWKVDNMKIFYIWYFAAAATIGLLFDKLRKKNFVLGLLGVALVAYMCGPAYHNVVYKEMSIQSMLATNADVRIGEWARENTGPEAVFLTDSRHNHPVPMFGGKSVFIGYKGWLSSRNYKYRERENAVKRILTGAKDALELTRKWGIDYVVLYNRNSKVENVVPDRAWLDANMKKVYTDSTYVVYEVKNKRKKKKKWDFGPIVR